MTSRNPYEPEQRKPTMRQTMSRIYDEIEAREARKARENPAPDYSGLSLEDTLGAVYDDIQAREARAAREQAEDDERARYPDAYDAGRPIQRSVPQSYESGGVTYPDAGWGGPVAAPVVAATAAFPRQDDPYHGKLNRVDRPETPMAPRNLYHDVADLIGQRGTMRPNPSPASPRSHPDIADLIGAVGIPEPPPQPAMESWQARLVRAILEDEDRSIRKAVQDALDPPVDIRRPPPDDPDHSGHAQFVTGPFGGGLPLPPVELWPSLDLTQPLPAPVGMAPFGSGPSELSTGAPEEIWFEPPGPPVSPLTRTISALVGLVGTAAATAIILRYFPAMRHSPALRPLLHLDHSQNAI